MAKFIFITGGVVSSLGKGITASSLAALLIARGFRVRLKKLDPYLNVDPGTMNPYQHGECFITYDGGETDLDLGHYERFTGERVKKSDNITSGQLLQKILEKERRGDFLGETVQWIPHVTDAIKDFIFHGNDGEDFVICEIGGTVGDIEALPFIDAIRQMGNDVGLDNVLYLHMVLLPYLNAAKEIKTKPAQHSVKDLLQAGIQPNILICRTEHVISDSNKKKISLFCNVPKQRVISGMDQKFIYDVVLNYYDEHLDGEILKYFHISDHDHSVLKKWETLSQHVHVLSENSSKIRIAIAGKYVDLKDAYISLNEALYHAAWHNGINISIDYIDSDTIESYKNDHINNTYDGIIVPGGYGGRGTEGKMAIINMARQNNIPFLGICYGAQMALIDIARKEGQLPHANSTEIDPHTQTPIIYLLSKWMSEHADQNIHSASVTKHGTIDQLGGTMRLGDGLVVIKPKTFAYDIYGKNQVYERHRHRYEINTKYQDFFEKLGVVFSGVSQENGIPEIIELTNHPWFIGVQYHPEFSSTPFQPHPLFVSFTRAAKKRKHHENTIT